MHKRKYEITDRKQSIKKRNDEVAVKRSKALKNGIRKIAFVKMHTVVKKQWYSQIS